MVELRDSSRRRVAILGAGPAGMTAAYVLSKDPGIEVTLFEADSQVGGMAKSIDLWGQRVDIGPHNYLSIDPRSNSLWLEVMGSDYSLVKRQTRIYSEKTFYNNPLENTSVAELAYPHNGTGEVYERMAKKLIQAGGHLFLSRPVKGLWTDGQKNTLGVELLDGEFLGFDHVISSMPLNKLILSIKEAPVEVRESALQLKFRNSILVYLEIEGSDLFSDQCIYIHHKELHTGRITNFRNWSPQNRGESNNSILLMEYWCYDDDQKWHMSDAHLIELAMKELHEMGLVEKQRILQGEVLRVPRCYPVFSEGYKEKLSVVEDFLQTMGGLQVIGRNGAFKFNSQDHSILMGRLAAENILLEAKHNLWKINTNSEYRETPEMLYAELNYKKTGTSE